MQVSSHDDKFACSLTFMQTTEKSVSVTRVTKVVACILKYQRNSMRQLRRRQRHALFVDVTVIAIRSTTRTSSCSSLHDVVLKSHILTPLCSHCHRSSVRTFSTIFHDMALFSIRLWFSRWELWINSVVLDFRHNRSAVSTFKSLLIF